MRASLVPKTKFAFKRKASSKPTTTSQQLASQSTSTPSSSPQLATPQSSTGLTISKHSHRYLTFSSLSSPWTSPSDLTISDLSNCVVNLSTPDGDPNTPEAAAGIASRELFTALHIRNLSNTVLILPVITGSALLHDLEGCVIALGSRQVKISPGTIL